MRKQVKVASVVVTASVLALAIVAGCPGTPGGTGGVGGIEFNLSPNVVLSSDVIAGVLPLTVQFSSEDSTDDGLIVARDWDFDDGGTSREISPSHTFMSTGEFDVTVTLTDDDGAQATETVTISVTDAPIARIVVDKTTAETSPATFEFDATTSSDPDGSIETYSWSFGDGTSSNEDTISHTYSASGTYRVRLSVTDDVGVRGSTDLTIQVGIPTPTIAFNYPPDTIDRINQNNESPLWSNIKYSVVPTVAYSIRAGFDEDTDPCNSQVVVYDPSTGDKKLTVTGHTTYIHGMTYTPDGEYIVTCSGDETIRINDADTGYLVVEIDAGTPVTALAVAGDSSQIAYGLEDGTGVFATLTGATILNLAGGHGDQINDIAFSPSGETIATAGADNLIILWDTSTGAQIRQINGHTASVNSVAYSPVSDNILVSASSDGTARVWNSNGTQLLSFTNHGDAVNDVAFSPDGSQVLSGGDNGNAILWNWIDGSVAAVFAGHTDDVRSVAIAPFGTRVATGSDDNTAKVWDISDGSLVQTVEPCESPIIAVEYSPTGSDLLVGVGAGNDTQLDIPDANGNDLTFATPQGLDIRQIAAGEYHLWVELDTDQTDPERVYANPTFTIHDGLPSTVATAPELTLTDDATAIIVRPSATRQIVDLGRVESGDRIKMSLLSLPSYGEFYKETVVYYDGSNTASENDGAVEVLVLDANEHVLGCYVQAGNRNTLFTEETKFVATHDSDHCYIVSDTATSLHVSIEREFGTATYPQQVYIDYTANTTDENVWAGDTYIINDSAFNGEDIGLDSANTQDIKNALMNRIRTIYANWDVTFTTSDDGDPPAGPHKTIYISKWTETDGGESLGVTDFVDPRNDSRVGAAAVDVYSIDTAFTGSITDSNEAGIALANSAAHLLGQLFGLKRTQNTTNNDIMDLDFLGSNIATATPVIGSGELADYELFVTPSIGIQDGAELLDEVIGAP